jgi:hypothetical protein
VSYRSCPPDRILCLLCFLVSEFSCLHHACLSLYFVCFLLRFG